MALLEPSDLSVSVRAYLKSFADHGGVYRGIVMSTRLMPDTDQVVWRILYADKDTEDFTAD